MMKVLVTGGAGFIGSHLCDALLERGCEVWCLDNLWLGRERNIAHLAAVPTFHFIKLDLLERDGLRRLFAANGFDAVFHLAANSDIRAGTADTGLDQKLNFQTTVEVLEAMRAHGVPRLLFASTSAVFGEAEARLNEASGPLQPISFYGASKLAAEAYVSVYAHTLGLKATVLRFPNVVGERATHGAIYDFLAKLEKTPERLEVLGNGLQSKPYVYVGDLVAAMLLTFDARKDPLEVYHVAGEGSTSVRQIAEIVVAQSAHRHARIEYTGGDRGWPGDVPTFSYDTSRIRALGWRPQRDSTAAVTHAVRRIIETGF